MKIAMLIAYDGSKFHGFARQPNARTIEGEILVALREIGISPAKIVYMSRTDRGVHAVKQLIVLKAKLTVKIAMELNYILPECIRVYAVSRVKWNFHPRRSVTSKTYLYVASDLGEDWKRIERVIEYLNAKEHEFSALIKRGRSLSQKTKMKVKIRAKEENGFQFFFVTGKYFLWEQVRRTVTLIKAYGARRLTWDEVQRVLLGEYLSWGIAPAPPEGLILWDAKIRGVSSWDYIIPENVIRRWIIDIAKKYAIVSANEWVFPPPRKIKVR
ncbi:MAG: tRNA pseudouridine synthase A [Candidatus Njordarchaeales archaeon]